MPDIICLAFSFYENDYLCAKTLLDFAHFKHSTVLNFLAHYYIGLPHRQQHDAAHHTLGLILPDLVRNANKQARLSSTSFLLPTQSTAAIAALHAGVGLHQKTDTIFHSAPFFAIATHQCKILLNEQPFSQIKRLSFLGHVAFELMLDRILMKEQPQLTNEFYKHLSQVDNVSIAYYLKINLLDEYNQSFLTFLATFLEHQYLSSYTDDQQIAYALCRIYQRGTGVNVMDERLVLANAIPRLERYVKTIYDDIFTYMSNALVE